MSGLYSRYIKPVLALGDTAAIAISSLVAYRLVKGDLTAFSTSIHFQILLYSLIAWIVCSTLLNTYKFYRVTRILKVIATALKAVFLYIFLIEATLKILDFNIPSRDYLYFHYLLLSFLVAGWRVLVIMALRYFRRRGFNYHTVIIVGYSSAAKDLKRFFYRHPEYGYRFLGFFDDNHFGEPGLLGKIDDIDQFVAENQVDEIYCCAFELRPEQVKKLLNIVDNNLVRIKFLPELGELHMKKLKVDFYDILPVLILRSIPLDDAVNKVMKRGFDIIFSLFVIIFVLSWLLPILAVIIRIDSKGPIFFKQQRSGIDNKKFECWKLRSMYVNSEANSQQAFRGDARITPVGTFLRKTSLDELPQFFNVFMGQMSVVGPRPHMLKHTQEYSLLVDKFMVRHFIKPGITGLSQVRGLRGDTTEVHQMRGRVKLDIFYLENWTFLLDLKIICYTLYNIFRGDKHAF